MAKATGANPALVLTVGHSTHALEQFLALLARHDVRALADVRRFPGSRAFPQFNRESLSEALREAGVEYHWLEVLGGRRHKGPKGAPSPNAGLRNPSFRNYADYMLTDEFRQGVDDLLAVAGAWRTAMMCAEAVYWRCHRRLVSDVLTARGVAVAHIMPGGELRPHQLTPGAVVTGDTVRYPGEPSFFS